MERSERESGTLGAAIVLVVGLGSVALQLVHAMEDGESVMLVLFGVVIPLLLSVGLVAGALWLARGEFSPTGRLRVAAWCVAGGILMALSGFLIILYQQYGGVVLTDQPYVVANTGVTGAVVGFVVGVYDAQRRVATETFAEERARAERLNQRLTVVNRVLRHDVRNSVNVIHGYADKLVEQFDDDDARRIRDRIMGLYQLTEMARTMERSIGDGREEEDVVDLVPALESIVEETGTQHPEVDIVTDLPRSGRVYANSFLETAIVNVVDNAVRHNDADSPRVTVSLSTQAADGTSLVALEIADNGPGIPAHQRAVFERGWESPLEHSLGTGLWLANWIAEDVGGRLSIEGNGSAGTTVAFYLRAAPEDATLEV